MKNSTTNDRIFVIVLLYGTFYIVSVEHSTLGLALLGHIFGAHFMTDFAIFCNRLTKAYISTVHNNYVCMSQ